MKSLDVTTVDVVEYPGWAVDAAGNMYHQGKLVLGTIDAGYVVTRQRGVGKIKRATLVCLAFHGPKPFEGAEVCHENDVHDDDRSCNLRWGTHQSNMEDAGVNGKMSRCGESHGRSLLSDADVLDIRKRYDSGVSRAELARNYGMSWSQMDRIVRRVQRLDV